PRVAAAAAAFAVALQSVPIAVTPAQAQQRAARFYVDSVADSTFVFRVGEAEWIRRGQSGIAVDPGQRDALVARFRIVDVSRDRATALITGQTTFLTGQHVALVERPRRPFWRRGLFWTGSVVGAALGLAAGLAF
ncbi:MAG: hypothetical protein ACYC2G_09685, partial [Gemmatimonadaceae bacterium]